MFIRQCQLRVEASAKQQLKQSLLAGRHVLTGAYCLLELRHIVTQLKLHLLLKQRGQVTQGVNETSI